MPDEVRFPARLILDILLLDSSGSALSQEIPENVLVSLLDRIADGIGGVCVSYATPQPRLLGTLLDRFSSPDAEDDSRRVLRVEIALDAVLTREEELELNRRLSAGEPSASVYEIPRAFMLSASAGIPSCRGEIRHARVVRVPQVDNPSTLDGASVRRLSSATRARLEVLMRSPRTTAQRAPMPERNPQSPQESDPRTIIRRPTGESHGWLDDDYRAVADILSRSATNDMGTARTTPGVLRVGNTRTPVGEAPAQAIVSPSALRSISGQPALVDPNFLFTGAKIVTDKAEPDTPLFPGKPGRRKLIELTGDDDAE